MDNRDKDQQMKLSISPDVAEGTYSNLVVISHAPTEIVMDFAQILPGVDGAAVRQRVILNPIHAKRMLNALADNLHKYEDKFGTIEEPVVGDTVPYDILGKA